MERKVVIFMELDRLVLVHNENVPDLQIDLHERADREVIGR